MVGSRRTWSARLSSRIASAPVMSVELLLKFTCTVISHEHPLTSTRSPCGVAGHKSERSTTPSPSASAGGGGGGGGGGSTRATGGATGIGGGGASPPKRATNDSM